MIGPVQFAGLQNHVLKKYRIRYKFCPPITLKILLLGVDNGLPANGEYSNDEYNLFYFCYKGVAGFVVLNKTKINDTILRKVWYYNFIGEINE